MEGGVGGGGGVEGGVEGEGGGGLERSVPSQTRLPAPLWKTL